MQFKLGPAFFIGFTFVAFLMVVISVSSDSWVKKELTKHDFVEFWEIGLWNGCRPVCLAYSASHGKSSFYFIVGKCY